MTATGVPDPGVHLLSQVEREAIVSALRAATLEERREVARVRSFRNILLSATFVLMLCAGGLLVVGLVNPRALPLCFTPDAVVCPTHTSASAPGGGNGAQSTAVPGTAATPAGAQASQQLDETMRRTVSAWDIAAVELVGLLAAAISAAVSLRRLGGTSTPYSLPTALAVLRLPTGAITAVLGILLIRGEFIPGLSALDSSGQIIAWAVIFGYAQDFLTRLIDSKAKGVLAAVRTVDSGKADVTIPGDAPPTPRFS
jgi:hypothetical protein